MRPSLGVERSNATRDRLAGISVWILQGFENGNITSASFVAIFASSEWSIPSLLPDGHRQRRGIMAKAHLTDSVCKFPTGWNNSSPT